MYCHNCGKQLNSDAAFCPYCGCAVQSFAYSAPYGYDVKVRRKVNGLSVAGFVIALISIAFGFLAVWINHIHYTGFNFQFLSIIPLAVALVLSIAGTVKSKKLQSGKWLGVAGILISGLILLGALLHFLFAEFLAKIFFTILMFIIALI